MQNIRSTFATARINRLIGQSFAAAAILLTAESTLNFMSQQPFINKPFAWSVAICLWLTTLAFVGSFFFGAARPIYLQIHALFMFVLVGAWPLLVIKPLPSDGHFYPWIWWAVDTGWLAAALSFQIRWAIAFFLGLNLVIQFIFRQPVGGSHPISSLVTDFLFTVLTNGTAAVIALLLRAAAQRTDRANAEAIETAVMQAKAEAQVRERERLDALVHDRVLTALISASRASNSLEAKAAADLANSAITKLSEVSNAEESGTVFTSDMFEAIITAAQNLDQNLIVSNSELANWQIDKRISSSLTEATLQAVQNSVLHAGSKAQRELILKTTENDLKIVIKDNGRGFRPNRIPRGRLGIRVSVISRVEAVGGKVKINSEPGKGSTIILEWSKA